MDLHDNVILDLLPLVRSGQASNETRALVERYLATHPGLGGIDALVPPLDPALEIRALRRARRVVGNATWEKAFALLFTALPFSFVIDSGAPRFVFAAYPGLIVGMAVTAAAFWARYMLFSKRMRVLR